MRWGGGWWVVVSQQQREIKGDGKRLLARLEDGDELGFWVHGAWDGAWLLDGFRWRVVVGWVWVFELDGGGHGGMEREREREREGTQSSKPSLVEHNRLYFNTGTARGSFRAFILLDA
ncbi:unnamed protein product [Prunus armeniaca]|uniref:Uncharacterized protein n=1 Tax=Prunus armeniaca TaxID=36596 RepID=A0A6J5TFN6_PRUAR|nr:unnamed protein product [Prunus armeniaca]